MKTEFELTLFDNKKNRKKLGCMNTLEVLFDDEDNKLPEDYYWFAEDIPLGTKIKVTLEVVES